MKNELISIIVPVYQVKEYVEECINSILNQTYSDIEILLIDDGSTDGSGEICDKYAEKDRRVKVIHQENKGQSVARNTGLRHSKGMYISFVDSDDKVKPQYIEKLYNLIKEYNAEIAVCDYIKYNPCDQNEHNTDIGKTYCITSEKMLKQWHGKRKRLETVVWNKLYRREIFINNVESIYFLEGNRKEDIYISHLLIKKANKVAITEQKLYLYRQRQESITTSKPTRESIRQDLEAQKSRMDFFRKEKLYGSYLRCLKGHMMHRVVYFLKQCLPSINVINCQVYF
jgi:glycosyltransferase involved in cell wall biosynthesis